MFVCFKCWYGIAKIDLQILINNVLDIWSLIDPARIVVKTKLHTLLHLIPNILKHGPATLYSTEIFECFNAIFRMCSILSNHLAPSRDIGQTFARMDRFKHIVCGGFWQDSAGDWIQASKDIRDFFLSERKLQEQLGWIDPKLAPIGMLLFLFSIIILTNHNV